MAKKANLREADDKSLKDRANELRAELREVQEERRRRMPKSATRVQPRIGGSFAPPLDAEGLKKYRELAESAEPRTRDAMLSLCDMVKAHHSLPKSKKAGSVHPSGSGVIVPLEDKAIEDLDPHVPYEDECRLLGELFDKIDAGRQKELRNAAFHLLWFANELTRDREPMTSDKL